MQREDFLNTRAVSYARAAAAGFLKADVDGDNELNFDEFCAMAPERVLSETAATRTSMTMADLRALFNAIDTDGNGAISIQELFVWVLSIVTLDGKESGGVATMDQIFRRYDASSEGKLDASELAVIAEDFGLSASDSMALFCELDVDCSGTICYTDLVHRLEAINININININTLALLPQSHVYTASRNAHSCPRLAASRVAGQPHEHLHLDHPKGALP